MVLRLFREKRGNVTSPPLKTSERVSSETVPTHEAHDATFLASDLAMYSAQTVLVWEFDMISRGLLVRS